jgi:hypothetical protein
VAPIDHTETVATAKADLERAGVPLSGPCGAFAIVQLAAWRLRASGAGLLTKNSGNNCQGFSVDSIAYPDGELYDVLGDGGGENRPQSIPQQPIDPTRFHGAFVNGVVADVAADGAPAAPPPPNPAEDSDEVLARPIVEALGAVRDKLERTATAIDALNTRLDTLKTNGVRVHL